MTTSSFMFNEPQFPFAVAAGQDPPRPAKDGYEWVWFPEGYWAERRTSRRTSSKTPSTNLASSAGKIFRWPSRTNAYPAPPQEHELRELSPKTIQSNTTQSLPHLNLPKQSSGSFSPPRTLPHSPWLSEAAQVQALQRPASQQMSLAGMNIQNEPSRRTRKRSSGERSATSVRGGKRATKLKSSWNLFQRSKIGNSTEALPEPTGYAAEEAAPSYFTQKPIEPPQALTPPEEKEEYGISRPLKSLRKWFSKVPQNREYTRSSPPTSRTSSSTSDTPKWIAPKSPEAVSVKTPPIKQSADDRPRSAFLDVKYPLPADDSVSSSASSARVAPRVFSYRQVVDAERREWWDAPKDLIRRDPVKGIPFFEFDMPEHLPSSPMCPANPMNKLRGKGVCVFHGRAKQASMDDETGIAEEDTMEST
ncbi:hypothetical protein F5883DRAFT_645815 [Diaporthe sp. PMI_573]|nr:hypothetical protein F5883DRAFT_645815 [Diaporthaceae sp. PMI_573]